jgi:hypothetical protein
LASIFLLDWLAYATTNSRPSSSSWVSTAPNFKVLQSMCNWNDRPQLSRLKMRANESLAFNCWKAYSCGSSQMNSWSICVNRVKGLVMLLSLSQTFANYYTSLK